MKFYLLAALVLVGCGSSDSDDSAGSPNITGVFKSECISDNTASVVGQITNDGSTSTLEEKTYNAADKSCAIHLLSKTTTRTFTIGGAVAGLTSSYEIDYTIQKIEMSPKTQAVADAMNAESLYGFTDWALNSSKDITGKGSFKKKSDVIYAIFKLDGSDWYGADASKDGSSKENRPSGLSNLKLKKQ